MKTIVVYVKANALEKGEFYPFHTSGPLLRYALLASALRERGADLVIAVKGNYMGSGRFRNVLRLHEDVWTKTTDTCRASVIFIKSRGLVQDIEVPRKLASHPYLESLSDDRRQLYQEMACFMPKTYVIDAASWRSAFEKIESDKVILKPALVTGSRGLLVVDKEDYEPDGTVFYTPYLAQEFVDTSAGLKDYAEGRYEIRLHSFNGVITAGLIRKAPAGRLLTQPNKVGCVIPISDKAVPKRVRAVAAEIDQQLGKFMPRFYAMDLLVTPEKVYLGALSSAPAFPEVRTEGEVYVNTFNALLADYLISRV